ncbi:DNA translocase FtsK [Sandarakinorhabdus sp. AAP62]|uniref:DNA translocase FtsK n=1 Tax=Sandarakinorhabdus sp. AAP62 TaxID=1248916 RepID=UPI00126735B5|nr:DNA translocase FtsK [Sandarakinorhabdus sp. AAP62]
MATRAATAPKRSRSGGPVWLVRLRVALVLGLRVAVRIAAGLAVALIGVALVLALLSYSPADPSFNTATARDAGNWMGSVGAHVADLLLQLAGWPMLLLSPALVLAGWRVAREEDVPVARMAGASLGGVVLLSLAAGGFGLSDLGAPAGPGGLLGQGLAAAAASAEAIPELADVSVGSFLAILLAPLGLALLAWGSAISREAVGDAIAAGQRLWNPDTEAEPGSLNLPKPTRPRPKAEAELTTDPEPGPLVVLERPERPSRSGRDVRDKQKSLDLGDAAVLPGLDLLAPPPSAPRARIDAAALEQNARLLEGVLEDFGVRGRIGEVRPGPVVTMYELEPAPGIRASRVIGLADDIARSMSAQSARVAVVPGKNVIGIELPNPVRETVSLSELLGSADFDSKSVTLPLVLGKDIAGVPVVADLAPMPHLLIAGTTGSGKSVGLNAMILSLLYRMTPAQCRLIMIDPKMLELKMYDGIPHLLAPVVVDPPKAIRALKWAVEQMEDRYRKMSELNVRSLASFNQKVKEAQAAGKPFVRRVQTGWDPETEMPIIEEEVLDFEPMPLIVVVVDELADLMMTAGKEVEFLIQRIAQKARAAGIHLIMATQRPSVDVITGVIKANLPTRISFQVTSKIDSRTILGEPGAEQLLGKGDMLWMAGGKLVRVHGPFVSDGEVEAVADFWRAQGVPDYVEAVTEEPADMDGQLDLASAGLTGGRGGDEEADVYAKAIDVVAKAQKASTSFIQRHLRIGYNNAARLIERMEQDGFVSRPDHVGRREVLIDEFGQRR